MDLQTRVGDGGSSLEGQRMPERPSRAVVHDGLVAEYFVDRARVLVYQDRAAMGHAAGQFDAAALAEAIALHGEVPVLMASAKSQDERYASLAAARGVDWSKVTAFHMDEEAGMKSSSPISFAYYARQHLCDLVPVAAFHPINACGDLEAEAARYSGLIRPVFPFAVGFIGIGENGHLAYNDPPVDYGADFAKREIMKVVELTRECREQQVHDGRYERLEDAPTRALSASLYTLTSCLRLSCVVPGPLKARAVHEMLTGPLRNPNCPASILREHPDVTIFLDRDSAAPLAA